VSGTYLESYMNLAYTIKVVFSCLHEKDWTTFRLLMLELLFTFNITAFPSIA